MRLTSFGIAAAAVALFSACSGADADFSNATLESEDQLASYAVGLNMGGNLAPADGMLDMPALMRGLQDAMAGNDPAVDQAELQTALQAFSTRVNERQTQQMEEEAETNRAEGAAYLEENAAREGVTTTESGLQYEVITAGDGPSPSADDRVRIHYTGTLIDGTEFDTSRDGEPAVFGVGGVIPGFSEGLQLMQVGSTYRFVIPSDIAYGPQGSGGAIGPDATLIFEVELLDIVE
ncbi:MAG TPA: FKBP-type peptidyl-prolyl cis-trans isomerase [Longimicrobiales bacterium]|nr:FKBP-type peptidyl-prolyl cis-trans isomerase [Longimicrobiales bacterium]